MRATAAMRCNTAEQGIKRSNDGQEEKLKRCGRGLEEAQLAKKGKEKQRWSWPVA